MTNSPPNDLRNFVHKRLIRAATGFITGGPLAAVGGFIAPTSAAAPPPSRRSFAGAARRARAVTAPQIVAPVVRRPVSRTLTARPGAISASEKEAGRGAKFLMDSAPTSMIGAGGDGCLIPFQTINPATGKCDFPAFRDQPDVTPIGATVMGRYGAGEVPGNMVVNRAICRPGMILGDDGVCYNRSQISNKQREWPRGRRPLLTGGDMRAISTAARAGKRLEGATKRLQKIGLMKKPAPRARARITSGATEHHHHD